MTWGCEHPGSNHSDDMIEVWTGDPTPFVLCGFHASQMSPRMATIIREARARRASAEKTPEQIAEIQRLRDDPRLP